MRTKAVMMVRAALLGAAGAVAVIAAPLAQADPVDPVPPPAPVVAAPAAPGNPAAAPLAVTAQEQSAAAGVPHLSSPDNLPPGTTEAPTTSQSTGLSYLRELWHAYKTQEVSRSGALLLLTQRPMNADSMPPSGMPAGPQAPVAPAAPTDEPVLPTP
nr:hypothetical protein [Mycolicibacterium palauense]